MGSNLFYLDVNVHYCSAEEGESIAKTLTPFFGPKRHKNHETPIATTTPRQRIGITSVEPTFKIKFCFTLEDDEGIPSYLDLFIDSLGKYEKALFSVTETYRVVGDKHDPIIRSYLISNSKCLEYREIL